MNSSREIPFVALRLRASTRFLIIVVATLLVTPGSAHAQVTNDTPLVTFGGILGSGTLAALGNDRVVIGSSGSSIGASGAGAAFLFNTNGTLLTTFTNPAPASGDAFGISVAAVGNDRVLIGAYLDDAGAANAGSAYLLSTNGTLVTTFTNPTPASGELFGNSVAAVGSGRVLIGAHIDGTGAAGAGSVYLFSTNGTLLTTITNPTPALNDGFGISVAVLGSDRLLIGAYRDGTAGFQAGAAYLYSTNGNLLATITNPVPVLSERFGQRLATWGNDRLLIQSSAGVLFMSTNGALITTFTNPSPAGGVAVGSSMVAVGTDRVLIGAAGDNTFGPGFGAAYLYGTNGTWLATYPGSFQSFGTVVATVGDRALISTPSGERVDLFEIPVVVPANSGPTLSLIRTVGTVSVRWVTPETGLILQQAGLLGPTADWKDAAESVSVSGQTNLVQQSLAATNRFYRLRKP